MPLPSPWHRWVVFFLHFTRGGVRLLSSSLAIDQLTNILGPFQVALYLVGYVIYNLFLHPLRRYPGPLLMRVTRMTYCYRHITGTLPFIMPDLHRRYGPVVRIAPDELAFADPAAWKDVFCYRAGGAEFEKSPAFYRPVTSIPPDISNAPKEEHSVLRRALAHGFSEKSLREQQPIISSYIDLMMRRLREHSEGGKAVDMAAWYNFTTFDIIGDLAFGER